ncbi:hypothetical protein EV379_3127 [Microterricola gilva]|uniref:Uncharacterized protein n=1 Tax=Microterricola gilva TaxID=393267 RepID=A0A4Q8ARA4_9MICO|nr:hypothetical protein [Microterricola gilva]RZU66761.1 hypothetical protein EV379_3127 [Microterricola gilva]
MMRPETATVAAHTDLVNLAEDMRQLSTAFMSVSSTDRALLAMASIQTLEVAELLNSGEWTLEAALAWLEAGVKAMERVA